MGACRRSRYYRGCLFWYPAAVTTREVTGDVNIGSSILLAALIIIVIRPIVLGRILAQAKMSLPARAFIGWFGPRGLNSLLLGLLVVNAALPDSVLLFATIGVVVMASL